MCTTSWLRAGEGFRLLFNRDERRSRARALPPRFDVAGGTRYLAPVDGAAGGTWIAVNEHGLLLALLNLTEDPGAPKTGTVSRGSIIPALISNTDLTSAKARLPTNRELRPYAPFRLLGRDARSGAVDCLAWDGDSLRRIELDPTAGLLCSSSLGDARVTAARTPIWHRLFAGGKFPSLAEHGAFQRSHEPRPSAESVCMHRDDAQTVSQVEIVLEGGWATMTYIDGPPCEHEPRSAERLELAL